MTTEQLFTAGDLTEYLGKSVSEGQAVMAERVVWGWIKPILKMQDRPDPVADELFSWAIELGAIAHENPTGRSAQTNGPFSVQYSARRTEILAEIAESTLTTKGLLPRGSFPCPERYPDPVRVLGDRRW